jgi:competence protein ComEC
MSCVLKVEAGGRVLLVTSDIEAPSEAELLKRHAGELHADVLIVPHHGSRTSSTEAFITAVNAPVVLFPVGYLNRFGHPKEEIVGRYAARGAVMYRTDRGGALSLDLGEGPLRVAQMREDARRYWQGQ